ncbi:lipid A-modifier LpxR family protein [Leptospira kobayashii]|uniref:lipid A-modifier LpxR family protein n=1 Tax=Leptospira kobayashii TaxID=1917830 RepID=UPI00107F6C98|nr:lipid A-modifier LpxR family protein [Leptospira kobayashii]
MNRFLIKIFFFYFICSFYFSTLFAEDNSKTKHTNKQILKFSWENDVFLFSDREYTNGIRLEYGLYGKTYFPASLVLLGLEKIVPNFGQKSAEYSGLSLTHSLYTPSNLYSSDASYGERPYSANAMVSSISGYFWDKSAFSIEAAIGSMGPNVRGKSAQAGIHRLTDSPLPQGWDRQLRNRNLFQLNLDYKYFWNPYLGIQTTIKLGNSDTSLSVGPVLRFGHVRSPVAQGMSITDPTPSYPVEETEYYFYIKPMVKSQFVNSTLGGSGKNPFSATIEENGKTSVYLTEGRTIFIGDPLYNSIGDERAYNTLTRFGAYQTLVPSDAPLALNFLVFNSIFNGAPVPNDGLKLLLLQNLNESNSNLSGFPGVEYFVYDTLFRNPTKGASAYSKILAYRYLNSNESSGEDSMLITALLLYNETNASKTYSVPLRRVQGRLSTGFVYQTPDLFFQMGVEISSLEYVAGNGLLPYHRYLSVQMGTKF